MAELTLNLFGGRKIYSGFQQGNLKESSHLGHLDMDGMNFNQFK